MDSLVAYPTQAPATQTIQPWMRQQVISIALDAPLSEAVALMHDHTVRRLPVVDADGKLCGIITTGDVRGADILRSSGPDLLAIAATLRRTSVCDVMTNRPLVIKPETTLCEAARLMRDYKIGGLPVVDDAHGVVGIITESDLFDALIASLQCPQPSQTVR